jgi:ribose 1,5-bisphosphokinase
LSEATTRANAAGRIGPGALVLVVGPSGAGKDTLIAAAQKLLAADRRIFFARRAITRQASASEDNEMVTPAEFGRAVADGRYALWWRAHEQGYGIARAIDDEIGAGRTVVINASRTIIDEARRTYQNAAVVLITAPAGVLAERLTARGRGSDGDLGGRLERASLATEGEVDLTISNVGAIEDGAKQLAEFIARLAASTNAGPSS